MSGQAVDMVGQRIGRLTVISRAENTRQNKAQWLCKCDCGNRIVVSRRHLKDSSTNSCGCLQREVAKTTRTLHGQKNTRLYRIWVGIKDRCLNPNSKYWDRYGGRGISVCEEWKVFSKFYDWAISNGYQEHLTIDRINNDGWYSPQNCRWATYSEQENNRSNNVHVTIDGATHTVAEWSRLIKKSRYFVEKKGKVIRHG